MGSDSMVVNNQSRPDRALLRYWSSRDNIKMPLSGKRTVWCLSDGDIKIKIKKHPNQSGIRGHSKELTTGKSFQDSNILLGDAQPDCYIF